MRLEFFKRCGIVHPCNTRSRLLNCKVWCEIRVRFDLMSSNLSKHPRGNTCTKTRRWCRQMCSQYQLHLPVCRQMWEITPSNLITAFHLAILPRKSSTLYYFSHLNPYAISSVSHVFLPWLPVLSTRKIVWEARIHILQQIFIPSHKYLSTMASHQNREVNGFRKSTPTSRHSDDIVDISVTPRASTKVN